jgi:hypothetical protein
VKTHLPLHLDLRGLVQIQTHLALRVKELDEDSNVSVSFAGEEGVDKAP